jgi:ABC-type dipeptide/oligopeptide/nickel transport system permease component
MALAILMSVAFVLINLINDMIYPLIDPRINQ